MVFDGGCWERLRGGYGVLRGNFSGHSLREIFWWFGAERSRVGGNGHCFIKELMIGVHEFRLISSVLRTVVRVVGWSRWLQDCLAIGWVLSAVVGISGFLLRLWAFQFLVRVCWFCRGARSRKSGFVICDWRVESRFLVAESVALANVSAISGLRLCMAAEFRNWLNSFFYWRILYSMHRQDFWLSEVAFVRTRISCCRSWIESLSLPLCGWVCTCCSAIIKLPFLPVYPSGVCVLSCHHREHHSSSALVSFSLFVNLVGASVCGSGAMLWCQLYVGLLYADHPTAPDYASQTHGCDALWLFNCPISVLTARHYDSIADKTPDLRIGLEGSWSGGQKVIACSELIITKLGPHSIVVTLLLVAMAQAASRCRVCSLFRLSTYSGICYPCRSFIFFRDQ